MVGRSAFRDRLAACPTRLALGGDLDGAGEDLLGAGDHHGGAGHAGRAVGRRAIVAAIAAIEQAAGHFSQVLQPARLAVTRARIVRNMSFSWLAPMRTSVLVAGTQL